MLTSYNFIMTTNNQKTHTGFIWDERYLKHETGYGHPESPARLTAIKEVLDTHPELLPLAPRMATVEEIRRIHTSQHLEAVLATRNKSTYYFDTDTPVSAHSADAALLAAGGVIVAIEAVLQKKMNHAFVFPRPPGHHAERDRAMGFCLFNNIAIGAEHLIHHENKTRIAIVDFDVHHGNGTQHSFYDRNDVFYISTHRYPFYPGTGASEEKGSETGEGYNLNIPLAPLSDDDDYEQAFDKLVVPALQKYQPEFVLVSAGFDAHQRDPLGGMKVSQKGFHMMASKLNQVARQYCEGKIVYVLEGGYDPIGLKEGVEAVLAAF